MADDADALAHVYLTLDDDDENIVLELVRVVGEAYFVRKNGAWEPTDSSPENDRIWDHQIVDMSPDAAAEYDRAESENADLIERERFEDYEIPDEELV